jgi:hypothetical protein
MTRTAADANDEKSPRSFADLRECASDGINLVSVDRSRDLRGSLEVAP